MAGARVRSTGALLAAALLVVPAAAGCGGDDEPGPPRPRADRFFGVNAHHVVLRLPGTERPRELDAMRRLGLNEVRYDARWDVAEPEPPVAGRRAYRWVHLDEVALGFSSRGLTWLPALAYSPGWGASYRGRWDSPPRRTADFAAFARAFVERYGRDGRLWRELPEAEARPVRAVEVWNEPNFPPFWKPRQDPERYARLYAATRAAVQEADPDVEVLVGGLAGEGAPFLRAMLAAEPGLRDGGIDGVAVHPYAGSPREALLRVAEVRRVLDRAGLRSVPISVTELGWPTRGRGMVTTVREDDRARALATVGARLFGSDCGVVRFLPYAWMTAERDPRDIEDWFGMRHPGGAQSATGRAYAALVERVRRAGGPPERPARCGT